MPRSTLAIILRYCLDMLLWEGAEDLPSRVPPPSQPHPSMPFQAVLYNDEHHTYDIVISVLQRSNRCSLQESQLLATIVDKDGRSSVCLSRKDVCERVRKDIADNSLQNSLRPNQVQPPPPSSSSFGEIGEEAGVQDNPLKVEVLASFLVAHQRHALRLLDWLTDHAKAFRQPDRHSPTLLNATEGRVPQRRWA